MKKILFIDRDGTILEEPATDFQIDSLSKFRFVPGVICALKNIVAKTDFRLVLVTNQDGLGTGAFPHENFEPLQKLMVQILADEGIVFDAIHIDPSLPKDNSPNRKPGTGMLKSYFNGQYNLAESFVIGDRLTDVELAENIGAQSIFLGDRIIRESYSSLALQTTNWNEIESFLTTPNRSVTIESKTNETQIAINLNLDRFADPEINTGIGFFDHMLAQIGTHSQISLNVNCKGDLEVDEHHTIEDVGLALGEAFAKAMSNKRGLNRYGFSLPMDEAAANVLIDFGGRPYLKWNVKLIRDSLGGIDSTLFEHFFRSFAQKAGCTLHIEATGENDHHIMEAVFKALARAIKTAIIINKDQILPSTKGKI